MFWDKQPAWGISRRGAGIRFAPFDDEGFVVRGDRRCRTGGSVLYKGRKRSHRFTILGDDCFEYDCILNREPDSNTVTLRLEGAEGFDFLRQPDFIGDPLLAGSYAVYKKETAPGEGTGKLCHIHRPEIIDASGRRVRGDLSISGDTLCITIPESWLSEARYPVVVDPLVGTAVIGSQRYYPENGGEYDPETRVCFETQIPVNRFLITETVNGSCTAMAYTDYAEDGCEAGGRPVFYTDNGGKPQARASAEETSFDFAVSPAKPAGWRGAALRPDGAIAGGSYIWFGIFTEYFYFPRFDYGAACYCNGWENYDDIPSAYPNPRYSYDYRLSLYFEYSPAQQYTRTLTQGVALTDTRTARGNFTRALLGAVIVREQGARFFTRLRTICQQAGVFDRTGRLGDYLRGLYTVAGGTAETNHRGAYHRFQHDTVTAQALSLRHVLIFIRLLTAGLIRDYLIPRFLKSREELVLKSPVTREIEIESRL